MSPQSKYRYKVNEVYTLNIGVFDENGKYHDKGTRVRIVAITPKVRIVGGYNHDSHEFFYNAVIEGQISNYGGRIREDFCTLLLNNKKEKI